MRLRFVLLFLGFVITSPTLLAQTILQGNLFCGDTRESTLRGDDENHRWSFRARAGDVVNIAVGPVDPRSRFSPVWTLSRGDGQPIGRPQSVDGLQRIDQDGEYSIDVRSVQPSNDQRYRLNVEWVAGDSSCAPKLRCGEQRLETLDWPEQHRAFELDGIAGQVLNIAVAAEPSRTQLFQPVWTLFDPTGRMVGKARRQDDLRKIEVDGPHVLLVEDSRLRSGGRFGVSVQSLSETGSCAPLIRCTDAELAQLDAPGQHLSFSFMGQAGEAVAIGVDPTATATRFDPQWNVFDPSGQPLGNPGRVPMRRVLRQDGLHTIIVNDHRQTGDGEIAVTFQRLTGNGSCRNDLVLDEPVTGELLYPGEIDAYTFEATLEEQFEFLLWPSDPSIDLRWSLYDPSGDALAQQITDRSGSLGAAKEGTYTLLVYTGPQSGGTSYDLRLESHEPESIAPQSGSEGN